MGEDLSSFLQENIFLFVSGAEVANEQLLDLGMLG
jgi:hypothetical protein